MNCQMFQKLISLTSSHAVHIQRCAAQDGAFVPVVVLYTAFGEAEVSLHFHGYRFITQGKGGRDLYDLVEDLKVLGFSQDLKTLDYCHLWAGEGGGCLHWVK